MHSNKNLIVDLIVEEFLNIFIIKFSILLILITFNLKKKIINFLKIKLKKKNSYYESSKYLNFINEK